MLRRMQFYPQTLLPFLLLKLQSVTSRPDKVIGMHFMNPVPVMKLVEIIRGYSTSDEVTNTV